MKKICLVILFFTICFGLYSQNQTLRILGRSNHKVVANSNEVIVVLKKDQHRIFKDALTIKGYNRNLESIINSKPIKPDEIKIKINEPNSDLFQEVIFVCNELKIKIEDIYFKIPKHDFNKEYKNAILAYKNAEAKAKIIANHLDCKVSRVLNIDDDTNLANEIFDRIDKNSEEGKVVLELINLLSNSPLLFKTESKKPVRESSYHLWVTFEIKPK